MRLAFFGAIALVAFSTVPGPAQPQVPPQEPDLALRVRELEERLARVEKQLAAPPSDTIRLGDVAVNLKDDRLQRYLRLVVTLRVDESAHRELSALVVNKKAELKTWLITYLSDQGIKDVSGSVNVTRHRDEMRRELGKILQQNRKENPVKEVLFEEYIVQ
jgi:flagellar basal body-associated protein FliL